MPATLSRSLLLSFAIAVAGPALAQSSDKDAQATPKPGTAKSTASRTAAPKRLDFVPSTNVKPTTTRQATPAAAPQAQPPAKHEWHCDGESSDA